MAKVKEQPKDELKDALTAGAKSFQAKKQDQVDAGQATVEKAKAELAPLVDEARKTLRALQEVQDKYLPVIEELCALDTPTLWNSIGIVATERLKRAIERAHVSLSGRVVHQIQTSIAEIDTLSPETIKVFHTSKIASALRWTLGYDKAVRQYLEELAHVLGETQQKAGTDLGVKTFTVERPIEERQHRYATAEAGFDS